MKFAKFLSHDGNQYREKWRNENLRNLISSSLTFWDRCQLLRLVAIDTLFLLRTATAGTQRYIFSNGKRSAKINEFWVRALHTAFYISNRCLTVSLPKGKTPFEMFFGKKPDLSNLKVFGCTAFKHIEKHQDKLSNKATKKVFVGYSEDSEAYILYNPYSKKTSFSRNVSFDETSFEFFAAHPSQNVRAFVTEKPAPKQVLTETQKHFCEKSSVPILPTETLNDFETETTPSPVDVVSSENIDANESSAFLRSRSGRVIKPPAYLDDYVLSTDDGDEDLTYREAMKSSLKSEWIEATQKEYDALIENKTWVLSPLPPGRKAIGSRWVF